MNKRMDKGTETGWKEKMTKRRTKGKEGKREDGKRRTKGNEGKSEDGKRRKKGKG